MSRMSWGWKITLVYCGFVVMIVALVGMSVAQKIDLVADDYYEQELNFQTKLDKINKSNKLITPVKWEVTSEEVLIKFPTDLNAISGHVTFYCPSDNTKDITVEFDALSLEKTVKIPRSLLQTGRYKMQIDWAASNEKYWNEGVIQI